MNPDSKEQPKEQDVLKKNVAKKDQQVSFSQLLRYATPTDYILMVAGTLSAMINGATLPVMTIIFGDIMTAIITFSLVPPAGTPNVVAFQNLQKERLDSAVTTGVIQMCLVGLGTFVFSYIQMTFWTLVGENQTKRIREKYFESLMRQDVGWFDNIETGDLTNRLSSDMTIIQEGLSDKVGLMIQFTSAFLAGFVIGYIKGWKLALVLTATLPVLAGAAMIMAAIIGGKSTEEQGEYAGAGAVAQQTLTAIKTVVAFGGEETQTKRYCEKLNDAEKTGVKKALINGVGVGSIQLLFFLVYSLAFWYGNKLVPDLTPGNGGSGELTVGQVLNVIFAIIIGAFSLGNATPHIAALSSARGAAKIVFETIDRVSPIDALSESGEKPATVKGGVEFNNIVFRYPRRPEVTVVKNISLKVEPGKTVALVGASGSGKSTIVKLLERFYDPTEGTVLLDGIDIKKLNVNWLRCQIGIVSQEPILFNSTVRENILLGLVNRDLPAGEIDALLERVCRQANCWDFIQKLPQKLDTKVGEAGSMMSGGQKQRISIARAIIKNPAILLLDEATSALDTESERIVQAALENASKNRTTIVIAHRLSTVKNADLIIVMDAGNVVEQGTHSELLDMNGMYAKLVEGQQLKMSKENPSSQETEVESTTQDFKEDEVFVEQKDTKNGDVVVLKLDKEEKEKEYSVPYGRLFKYNKKEYPIFVLAGIGAMANGASQPLFALVFANVLTALGTPRANDYALLFVALAFGAFLSNFLQIGLFGYAAQKMTRRVREACFRSILRQEMAFFDREENATGSLTQKLSSEASSIAGLTGQSVGALLQGIAGIATGLTLAFIASWRLSLLILGMVPLIGFAGYLQLRALVGFGEKTRIAYEDSNKRANETILNIRTVATLTQERSFYGQYAQSMFAPHRIAVKGAVVSSVGFAVSQAVLHFAWAASLFYGSYLLKIEIHQPTDILNSMFAIIFTAMAAGQVNNFSPDVAKGRVAAKDVFEILDRVSDIDVTKGLGEQREQCIGTVTGKEITFEYPTRPDTKVLQGLNLEAMSGKTVALVGQSGCGKSTMMGLLLRWYDITGGELNFDDLSVKKWNLTTMRSFMAIVGQEPVLFNTSVRDNIAFGSLSPATDEAIFAAAKLANIHDFVMSLPDKYDTLVGEKGGSMSGGQKQRIAIARALIRNPKLLLLDEATSALDSESEVVVQQALDAAAKGRTTLVIAHRLSTIQNADLILVVEKGVVVESGNHFELIERKGSYYNLVNQQSLAK